MKDRLLVAAVVAGCCALGVGLVADVAHFPRSGIIAGGLGFLAAILATTIAAKLHTVQDQVATLKRDNAAMRRELDALAAIFAEEASGSAASRALALAPPVSSMEAMVDTASGLLEEQHFKVLVQKRVAAARRQLQPISIVMFEVDDLDAADVGACNDAVHALGAVITETLRESDAACRIGATMAAAILEDTSEAGAVWAAERIRGTLHQRPDLVALTVSAGIACYPTHALSAPELMERAGRALELARAGGRDRLEVATGD